MSINAADIFSPKKTIFELNEKDALLLKEIIAIKVVHMDFDLISHGISLLSNFSTKALSHVDVDWNRKRLLNGRGTMLCAAGKYEDAIKDFNATIGDVVACKSEFEILSLQGRAKAYEATRDYNNALIDLNVLMEVGRQAPSMVDVPSMKRRTTIIEGLMKQSEVGAKWKRIFMAGRGNASPKLFFHTTVLHPDGDHLVVYGGLSQYYNDDVYEKDVHLFDLSTNTWSKKICRGKSWKSARHSAVVYGRNMYVLGGSSRSSLSILASGVTPYIGDFRVLNLDTYTWKTLPYSKKLNRLKTHTAVVWKNEMIVFGGEVVTDDNGDSDTNGMSIFNFTTSKWSIVHYNQGSTYVPIRRHVHTAWVIKDHLYIFGGTSDESRLSRPMFMGGEYLGCVYGMDLTKKTWIGQVQLSGRQKPAARGEMQAAVLNDQVAFMYGGYAERCNGSHYFTEGLRFENIREDSSHRHLECNELCPKSRSPPSLGGATFTADPKRNRCLLFGGYNGMENQALYGDVWEFKDRNAKDVCGKCGKHGRKKNTV